MTRSGREVRSWDSREECARERVMSKLVREEGRVDARRREAETRACARREEGGWACPATVDTNQRSVRIQESEKID